MHWCGYIKWKRASCKNSMFAVILSVFLLNGSYVYSPTLCFYLMVITTCCSCTVVTYLHVVSLLLSVWTLNIYVLAFLLPLSTMPSREEIRNKYLLIQRLVNIESVEDQTDLLLCGGEECIGNSYSAYVLL